jgi:hypothetical protein
MILRQIGWLESENLELSSDSVKKLLKYKQGVNIKIHIKIQRIYFPKTHLGESFWSDCSLRGDKESCHIAWCHSLKFPRNFS